MPTTLAPLTVQKFFDNNGVPLVSGKLFTYSAGTTTPVATYTDSTGGTPNANPVVLNARGEAGVWLTPNVGYKFVLQDSLGNTIWTVDNITNSQLITLYGGVDTGVASAYVLNFAANFTAYTDGIVIVWIPNHTNSGASTINVNGLGVVAITNYDGSALVANEIVLNQPAQILYKAGAFLLLGTNGTSGSFTGTWGGFSTPPATTITWKKIGNLVTLVMPASTGTSNAPTFILVGLPSALNPVTGATQSVPCFGMMDNGAAVASASMVTVNNAGVIAFSKDASGTGWTASGTKGFQFNSIVVYTL